MLQPCDPSPPAPTGSLAATPWAVLIGVHDPAVIAGWSASAERLLMVQPNPLLLARLREFWDGRPPAGVEISGELPAAESGVITWYAYNDGRFDGVCGPDALRRVFANLVLLDQQPRVGLTLHQLLLDWWQRSGDPGGCGVLVVQGDLFEAVVRGAGPLIDRFDRLIRQPGFHDGIPSGTVDAGAGGSGLVVPAAAASGAASVETGQWLEEWCFTPLAAAAGGVTGWQRDRYRLLQRQFDQLQAAQAQVLGERDAWCLQREQLQLAFELMQQRLNGLVSAQVPGLEEQHCDDLLGRWADWQR